MKRAALLLGVVFTLCPAAVAQPTTRPADFHVKLPAQVRPFPEPLAPDRASTSFKIRGTKGWNWTPQQYLEEIPTLAAGNMNFLMNCYLSLYSDPEHFKNEWWLPIPEAKKQAYLQVIKKCQENNIQFCFAMHPQLHSPRPLDPTSDKDLDTFYSHFAWAQSVGVKWFCISLDDVGGIPIDASQHARFANAFLKRLRDNDRSANLIFCPTHYAGLGTAPADRPYLQTLARELDPSVYVFWTGPEVISRHITLKDAETFKSVVKHRLILWDNYPVNDASPALHLGPVTGRDPRLPQVVDGYMANPLCPQSQINRIPLLTCADYAYNPLSYNPDRSVAQAILHLADTPEQRQTLKDLVELYPGNLAFGQDRSDYNTVRERFTRLSQMPHSRVLAVAYLHHLEDVLGRLKSQFPGQYQDAAATLRKDIDFIGSAFSERFPQ